MFKKTDKTYLNQPNIYSMALEKYFFDKYYNDLNCNASNETPTRAYQFSNEYQSETFKTFLNKNNKRVLTVGSSGDQVLNAIFYGATDVTLIDVNLYSKYFVEYKIAAIKNMDYDSFMYYFYNTNETFTPQVYQKIFHDLSPDAQTFWGTLFLEDTPENIFWNVVEDWCRPEGSEFYLYKQDFNQLKSKLKRANINYINAEFKEFPNEIDGKYDLIMLSNIYDYVGDNAYKRVINDLYENHLKNSGQIQLYYQLGISRKKGQKLFKLFPDKDINQCKFNTTYSLMPSRNFTLTKPDDYISDEENIIEP